MTLRTAIEFRTRNRCARHKRALAFAALLGMTLPAAELAFGQTDSKRASPTYRKVAEGFFVRPVSETTMPGGRYRLRIWTAIASPGRISRPIAFPGAAALIVQSGGGAARSRGGRAELRLGGTLSLNAGKTVAFENRGTRPIKLRVVIVEAL